MNYTNLVQSIKDFTENEETTFVSQLDTFIEFAELRILRDVDLNAARKYATATLATGDTFLSLPTDAVVVRSVQVIDDNARDYLQQKDPSFINEYITDRTVTGTPRYYTHHDHNTLLIVPAPSSDLTVEVGYTHRPTHLSSTNETNWLGDEAPNVLLYAVLVEAYMFMKGEGELLSTYEQKYGQALQALLMEENLRNRQDEYINRTIKFTQQRTK